MGLVQELAAAEVRDVPDRYVQKESRPIGAIASTEPIPILNLSRLSESNDEMAKLRSALLSWGLFVVADHEIPAVLLDEMLSVTREFFYRPVQEKQNYTNMVNGKDFQYEGYGNDRVDTDEQILDWCDRLHLVVQPEDERKLDLWPKHPNSFRDILHEFTVKSEEVAKQILRAIAKTLEFNEEFFVDQLGDRVSTYARSTFYPKCPRPDLVFGLKPHSDNSVITILLLDKDVGGLQVLKDGMWIDIPALSHELLVIVGDEMEIMSNGIFKAPVHRVATNSEKDRISVVMFYAPEPDKDLAPADGLVDEKRPALYNKVNAKVYSDTYFDAFAQGERALEFAGIKTGLSN